MLNYYDNATRSTPRCGSLFKELISRGISYKFYASIIYNAKLLWLEAILVEGTRHNDVE
jgi:hypothetical protein